MRRGRKVDDNPENLGRVDMTFHHAQTWIQFKATCEQNLFRIDNIVVENVYTGGLFRVANGIYTDADWIFRGHRKTNVSVPNSRGIVLDKNEPKALNILLPEQPACDIVIHYSRRPSEESGEWTSKVYRYPAGSDTWFYGEKYVLNLNFTE